MRFSLLLYWKDITSILVGGLFSIGAAIAYFIPPDITTNFSTYALVEQNTESKRISLPTNGSTYMAMIERPLFHEKRRPLPRRPDEATLNAERTRLGDLQTLHLVGTIIAKGKAMALVMGNGEKETRQVREGEELLGWKVIKIKDEGLVLTGAGLEQMLRFPEPQAGQATMGRGATLPAAQPWRGARTFSPSRR